MGQCGFVYESFIRSKECHLPLPPPPFPLFCPRFYFRATTHARKCSWYIIRKQTEAARLCVYKYIQYLSKKSSLVTSFGIIYYKTRKTSGKFLHLFQYTCVSGGALAATFLWPTKLSKERSGRVSLLDMVPGDHSVKNYRSTE